MQQQHARSEAKPSTPDNLLRGLLTAPPPLRIDVMILVWARRPTCTTDRRSDQLEAMEEERVRERWPEISAASVTPSVTQLQGINRYPNLIPKGELSPRWDPSRLQNQGAFEKAGVQRIASCPPAPQFSATGRTCDLLYFGHTWTSPYPPQTGGLWRASALGVRLRVAREGRSAWASPSLFSHNPGRNASSVSPCHVIVPHHARLNRSPVSAALPVCPARARPTDPWEGGKYPRRHQQP